MTKLFLSFHSSAIYHKKTNILLCNLDTNTNINLRFLHKLHALLNCSSSYFDLFCTLGNIQGGPMGASMALAKGTASNQTFVYNKFRKRVED